MWLVWGDFLKGNEKILISLGPVPPRADKWLQRWADFSQKTSLCLRNETLQQPVSRVLVEKTEPTFFCCHWACPPLTVWNLAASFEEQGEDMFLILNSHGSQHQSPECHGN